MFRRDTVRRRLNYRLEKVLTRLHIRKVCWWRFNIDEVIEIIRNEDEPKPALMSRFGLYGNPRREAILELKLRHSCQTGRDEDSR